MLRQYWSGLRSIEKGPSGDTGQVPNKELKTSIIGILVSCTFITLVIREFQVGLTITVNGGPFEPIGNLTTPIPYNIHINKVLQ